MSKPSTEELINKMAAYVDAIESDYRLADVGLEWLQLVLDRLRELEAVVMTESEKRDLLSKDHYRDKIRELEEKLPCGHRRIDWHVGPGDECAFCAINEVHLECERGECGRNELEAEREKIFERGYREGVHMFSDYMPKNDDLLHEMRLSRRFEYPEWYKTARPGREKDDE